MNALLLDGWNSLSYSWPAFDLWRRILAYISFFSLEPSLSSQWRMFLLQDETNNKTNSLNCHSPARAPDLADIFSMCAYGVFAKNPPFFDTASCYDQSICHKKSKKIFQDRMIEHSNLWRFYRLLNRLSLGFYYNGILTTLDFQCYCWNRHKS